MGIIQFEAVQAVPARDTHTECIHTECSEQVEKDYSHRLAVGISHYVRQKDGSYMQSYSQVFQTMHCCSRDHAVAACHARIDKHATLPFGKVTPDHNPDNEWDATTHNANLLYHPVSSAHLPTVDAITGESLINAANIYVPHVDDSTLGTHYQNILLKTRPNVPAHAVTLGTGTLDNALALAHAIVDEIIVPHYEAVTGGQAA